jgi:hypothetical protein
VESLVAALKATQVLLQESPVSPRYDASTDPYESKKSRRTLSFVLETLRANFKSGQRFELIGDLKDAISKMHVRQQDNERTFKLVWNLYVIARQHTGRRSSVDNVSQIQDQVGQARDAVLHAFHLHPFAISPEGESSSTIAALNHSHDTAARYEELARQIGKAWVDDGLPQSHIRVRDIESLKTSLFELVWSGMIERLKNHSAYSSDDPERAEFQLKLTELEMELPEAIVRSKNKRFTIAFCGMVKAGKSLFLNALMGRSILPSDGESDAACSLLS